MKYLVVIESNNTGYSGYSLDIEGCIATGSTLEEVKQNMQEAIDFHLSGLKLEGYEIPQPKTTSTYIEALV